MEIRVIATALVAMVALSACSVTPVALPYDASGVVKITENLAAVELGGVADHRKNDARWLGAIRGGYGNPLKVLETPAPVAELVRSAFADGLKARGLLASDSARVKLELDVIRMDCSQLVRREAHAAVQVTITDRRTGAKLHQKLYLSDKVQGELLALDVGIFAEVEDLRRLANQALQEVVDQALADPQLLQALKPPAG